MRTGLDGARLIDNMALRDRNEFSAKIRARRRQRVCGNRVGRGCSHGVASPPLAGDGERNGAMIIGWLRLALVGLVVLTLIYWLVSVYSRSVRREALEREWEAGPQDRDRDAFVAEGLRKYQHGLRRRLILLVYIVPAVVIPALIYILNFE